MMKRDLLLVLLGLPLRVKLGGAFAVIIGAALLGLNIYIPQRMEAQGRASLVDKAETIAEITAYGAAAAVVFNDSVGLAEIVSAAVPHADVAELVVRNAEGVVLRSFARSNHSQLGAVRAVAAIEHDGALIGTVTVRLSTRHLENAIRRSRWHIAVLGLLVFAATVGLAFVLTTIFTRPLSRVASAAAAIARGGDLVAVPVTGTDEVGQLATTFNHMLARLRDAHSELVATNASLEERVRDRTARLEEQVRERLRAEADLRASERRFRTIFEASAIGIVLLDASGAIIEANPGLLAILEQQPETIAGVRFTGLLDEASAEGVGHALRTIAGPPIGPIDATIFAADGRVRAITCTMSAVRTGPDPLVIVLIHDVTEQRELEERYRQAQKLEAVGQLAGGVAHDFNNLLTTINGVCDLLLAEVSDPRLIHDLEEVRNAGDRAAQLTRQLLAFSRRQVLQPALLDLNRIVTETSRMLRRVIGENIDLRTQLAPGIAPVRADGGQILQVIMNLAVNARDAMPEGGQLLIATDVCDVDDDLAATFQLAARGRHVRLTVRDSGRGMDSETLAHAFEPFFTTKPVGKGTGLGLATVYGIVKQSAGGVIVRSAPGAGTTVTILFPAAAGEVEPAQTAANDAGADRRSGTILVVEDEAGVRSLLLRVLRRAGYNVLEATDGACALQMARAHPGVIDLLLTDVVMPNMSGPEVARILRPERPEMRIVFMSGYTPDAVRVENWNVDAAGFLEKPMSPAALLETVAEALGAIAA